MHSLLIILEEIVDKTYLLIHEQLMFLPQSSKPLVKKVFARLFTTNE
jgi:hypothetical protein